MNELERLMRASWDRRAKLDAMHHVCNARPIGEWQESDFFKTGEETVTRSLVPFLKKYVSRASSRTCLEIGCGVGRETAQLAGLFRNVTALDVSPEMVKRARQLVTAENVKFLVGSGIDLDVVKDKSVSFVYSAWVFQHISDVETQYAYLREVARVLRPNGWYYIHLYADQHDYARLKSAWRTRAKAGDLMGWSEAARVEIESGEYKTWMCTAVDPARVKQTLRESGLSLIHSAGEYSKAWHIGGQKA